MAERAVHLHIKKDIHHRASVASQLSQGLVQGWVEPGHWCMSLSVCLCVCVQDPPGAVYVTLSLSLIHSPGWGIELDTYTRTHTSCLQHSTHFRKGGFVTTLSPGQPFNTTLCVCVTDWACTRSQWYSQGWILVQDRRELSVRLRKWAAPHPGWERLKDAPSISVTRGLSLAYRQDGHFLLRSVHTNAVLGH